MRPSALVAFDGQSLNNGPSVGNSPPELVMSGLSNPWINLAINGQSWTALANLFGRVAYGPLASFGKTVLVLNGGQSDLLAPESNTGLQAFTDLSTYITAARSFGVDKVIVCTLPHSTQFPSQAEWNDFNARIRGASSSLINAVADCAADARLADSTNATYFNGDQLHLTAAGAAVMAGIIKPLLVSQLSKL